MRLHKIALAGILVFGLSNSAMAMFDKSPDIQDQQKSSIEMGQNPISMKMLLLAKEKVSMMKILIFFAKEKNGMKIII